MTKATCKHCGASITLIGGAWEDEAGGVRCDDYEHAHEPESDD